MTVLTSGAAPGALVPGDPDGVDDLARRLDRFAHGAVAAADLLRGLDAGSWVGPAAEAFRAKVGELPRRLDTAAESFAAAARALREYSRALHDARQQAARAVDLVGDAERITGAWRSACADWDRAVLAAARATGPGARPAPPPVRPPAACDPGADERAAAHRLLADARADLDDAGRRAAARLHEAARTAPAEPSLLQRGLHQVGQFLAGAGEATWGLVQLGVTLSPTYALVDPDGFLEHGRGLADGVVYGVQNPRELAKAVLDWQTWQDNPARALGHLVPDLVLAVGTAGAGNAATAGSRAATAGRRLAAQTRNLAAGGTPATNAARLAAEAGDLARAARAFQGRPPYPGVDPGWRATTARQGERIWVASPFEGQFAVPDSVARHVGRDGQRYFEGVQVAPKDLGAGPTYRSSLQAYDVQQPFPQAESLAVANRQFGAGGLPQILLPGRPAELVELGLLRPGPRVEFADVTARLPETGVTGSPPRLSGPAYTPPPPWRWDVPAGAAAGTAAVGGSTAVVLEEERR